ncbi:MAG: YidH family protein [Alphaproteobacteria bacterium]
MSVSDTRFEATPTASNHFAWLRTRLSVDRTLMAWMRTATALIGFGFTIVQFFERLGSMEGVAAAARPQMPRYLGLALIVAGVLALVISCWQYRRVVNHLWSGEFRSLAGMNEDRMHTPVFFVAFGLIVIGIFAFVAVYTRAL